MFDKNVFLNFQKLAGLWLIGEVVNHVCFYESSNIGIVTIYHAFCIFLPKTRSQYEEYAIGFILDINNHDRDEFIIIIDVLSRMPSCCC